MSTFTTAIKIVLGVIAMAIMQKRERKRKEIKVIQVRNEELILPQLTDIMILYIK